MEILRSWLFVPAGRERMLENAAGARADALVLDLEDAVPVAQKAAARKLAARWIPRLASKRRRLFVRINGVRTGLARDDLLAVVGEGLTGVVVPKVDRAQDLRDLDVLIREAETANDVRPGDVVTVPLIESARALLRCEDIVRASDRVAALSIGAEDYANDLGIARSADSPAINYLRSTVANVAVAYALQAIDTPCPDHRDAARLVREAETAKSLGLKGKYAIHPDQVVPINKVFSPSPEEVEDAKRIVAAYDAAMRNGRAVTSLDGRMIDAPVVERARALLAAKRR